MQIEKDRSEPAATHSTDASDDSIEKSIGWLLDREMEDPEETLFKLSGDDLGDWELTDYERAVAGRPLSTGQGGSDDLSGFVDEEIVISSESESGGIYTDMESPLVDEAETIADRGRLMAVDHSRQRDGSSSPGVAGAGPLPDGEDILGLLDDDDIGETFVSLKRVRSHARSAADPASVALTGATGTQVPPATDDADDGLVAIDDAPPPIAVEGSAEPSLVAIPGFDDGANEESGAAAQGGGMTEGCAESLESLGSVQEYVACHAPPLDDEAFDRFLLAGDSLDSAGADFDSLRVDSAAGIVSVDPCPSDDIDYHEDFLAMENFDRSPVLSAASALPQLEEARLPHPVDGPQADEAEQQQEVAGFSDDVLEEDFAADWTPPEVESTISIDDVFANLTGDAEESDVICGVDLAEFETADSSRGSDGPIAAADIVRGPGDPVDGVVEDAGSAGTDGVWYIPSGIDFAQSSSEHSSVFADFLDAFVDEGAQELEKLEGAVGEWEMRPVQEEAAATVGRVLHTLKGIARGVGLQCYGTLIHNFETLLEGMQRPHNEQEAESYFAIVNIWLDAAVRGLDHVREHRADILHELPAPGAADVSDLTDLTASAAVPEIAESAHPAAQDLRDDQAHETVQPVRLTQRELARQKQQDQQLADEGAKVLAAQQSVRITSDKLDHLLNLANQAQQLGVRSAQNTASSKRVYAELQGRLTSVGAHIAKIADRAFQNVTARGGPSSTDMDALEMDQYSELQEAASILREGVEDLSDLVEFSSRQNSQIEVLLKQQSSVISTIGSSLQAARVVPVSRLMPGLRRIVRTVGADLGKSVAFRVLNEVGALDRDDYARCQTALEHMVRNALDHGIESPDERLACGKATTGLITIDVRKSGADYVINLTDDGRGMDADVMRELAYEKALDIDIEALSDDEALRLIFRKGFSTAQKLSEVSGRGVGMDIVLNELQQVGGDIQIRSVVGEGTTFELRIPSNVSVNGALFVTAGNHAYAVPLNGLIAIEHIPVAEFFTAVEGGSSCTVNGLDCTPAYLGTLCQADSLPERDSWGATVPVIIAGSSEHTMAIAVDSVEEALELVIRSLGAQFASVHGVAGAATTSDGEAVVALDLNVLVESVSSGDVSAVTVHDVAHDTLLALVVDDSRTQRMVATSQFDNVGVETVTAENGMVALDMLNSTHRLPDIILLDVEMPVKDGIETLREIRKSPRYGHLPVIMVTSRTGSKHRRLAAEAGCNGYMGKPFNFPALVAQISDLTGHKLQLA